MSIRLHNIINIIIQYGVYNIFKALGTRFCHLKTALAYSSINIIFKMIRNRKHNIHILLLRYILIGYGYMFIYIMTSNRRTFAARFWYHLLIFVMEEGKMVNGSYQKNSEHIICAAVVISCQRTRDKSSRRTTRKRFFFFIRPSGGTEKSFRWLSVNVHNIYVRGREVIKPDLDALSTLSLYT